MIVIIAHHYVVNSGLSDLVYKASSLRPKDVFLLIFGWGGKTGINCFVLITGYFMCTSRITIKKYGKLIFERYFYAILFFSIFVLTGYIKFSGNGFWKVVFPFSNIKDGFTGCFLLFYLFIPFLNKLIHVLNEKEHFLLVMLCLMIYSILPTFFLVEISYNYITWFIILYFIAAFIRLYPQNIFKNSRLWGAIAVLSILVSWSSVAVLAWIGLKIGHIGIAYFFVSDSNKVLALITAVSSFLFFKNLQIRHSRSINRIAASTFGVLLIHTNSDAMRQWLWCDLLKNTSYYNSCYTVFHAVLSVAGVFIICTLLDQVRILLIEAPVMHKIQNFILHK